MYKVFVEDSVIEFGESVENISSQAFELPMGPNSAVEILDIVHQHNSVRFIGNAESSFLNFKNNFKVIEAAGGFIVDQQGASLWIYRNDIWDLPKGKIDKGENAPKAAIREIQEETGLVQMEILRDMPSTWHIYPHKGEQILKRTYWYLISAESSQQLLPEESEGITEVRWVPQKELQEKIGATYASLRDLLRTFLAAHRRP